MITVWGPLSVVGCAGPAGTPAGGPPGAEPPKIPPLDPLGGPSGDRITINPIASNYGGEF